MNTTPLRSGIAVATALAMLAAAPVTAQHYVALESPGEPGSCEISPGTGLVTVDIVHYTGGLGVTAVQFAAPVPSCLGAGAAWVADVWPYPLVIGGTQTGAAISYGGCFTGPIHVGSIWISIPGTPEQCCHMQVVPDPSAPTGRIEAVDCAATRIFPVAGPGAVFNSGGASCAGVDPPTDPVPADAETYVALDATLSWTPGDVRNPCLVLAYPYGTLALGTHPDSLATVGYDVDPPFDPGPLSPLTTYYWQVSYAFLDSGAQSPVWSFTTRDAVPARATTWGRLKALYE